MALPDLFRGYVTMKCVNKGTMKRPDNPNYRHIIGTSSPSFATMTSC